MHFNLTNLSNHGGIKMELAAAKMIGAGIAMVAALGSGIGLGLIFASWVGAIARNPSAEKKYPPIVYIGAGMTEAIALFALVLAFLIIFL
jgi:F0F1-type ATP synthase membrane subunit c/vacuolar-type H+-ATPase subunit K